MRKFSVILHWLEFIAVSAAFSLLEHNTWAHTTTMLPQQEVVDMLDHSIYYIPDAKVMLCILPKAGTTSFFNWLYNNVLNKCWKNDGEQRHHMLNIQRFRDLPRDVKQEVTTSDDVFRFSLVREPVSRAISGWKSKLACDSTGYQIDRQDRPMAIRELYKLSGSQYLLNVSCLELDQFADELLKIKASGHMGMLHKRRMLPHFASSSLTCLFDHIEYQQIVSLESFKFAAPNVQLRFLADRLNVSLEDQPFKHMHQSSIDDGVAGDIVPSSSDAEIATSTHEKLRLAYSMDYASIGTNSTFYYLNQSA